MLNALRLTEGVPTSLLRRAHGVSALARRAADRRRDAQGPARARPDDAQAHRARPALPERPAGSCSCPTRSRAPRVRPCRSCVSKPPVSSADAPLACADRSIDGCSGDRARRADGALARRRAARAHRCHRRRDRSVGAPRRGARARRSRPLRRNAPRTGALARDRHRRQGHHRTRATCRREMGSPVFAGHRPRRRRCVARLRAAGGYVFGKTVTTELAFFHPGKTRNPWNAAHTPGGSSSGSAAAVAAGHVAGALGTQTNGSIIRPAAYCGVVGFKPTAGAIPFAGVNVFSETLDTLGTFARSVRDAALLAGVLADVGRSRRGAPPAAAAARVPRPGFPWSHGRRDAADALERAVDDAAQAGARDRYRRRCRRRGSDANRVHRTIMFAEAARNLDDLRRERGALLRRSSTRRSTRARESRRAIIARRSHGRDARDRRARRSGWTAATRSSRRRRRRRRRRASTRPATRRAARCGRSSAFPALNLPIGLAASGLPLGHAARRAPR